MPDWDSGYQVGKYQVQLRTADCAICGMPRRPGQLKPIKVPGGFRVWRFFIRTWDTLAWVCRDGCVDSGPVSGR